LLAGKLDFKILAEATLEGVLNTVHFW